MKKILIVKIGAIGDVVMALPLITEIRRNHPDAHITWLCGKIVVPILERTEGIDELIPVDENKLLNRGPAAKAWEILRIWIRLAGKSYDLQLYFYKSPLYKILTLSASFREIRGFRDQKTGSRLPVTGRHHSIEYLRAFNGSGGPDQLKVSYPEFKNLPRRPNSNSATKKIAFACGGARNILQNNDLRRWPLSHYRRLAEMAVAQGHEIILTGGPGDAWVNDGFIGIPHQSLIGSLSLTGFIEFLCGADVLVTHDSGPLHLADLANCPVLGLFGPTRPADFRSLQDKSDFIWGGEHLSCRPCYDGKDYGNCSANECLKSISPEQVFEKLRRMLAQ